MGMEAPLVAVQVALVAVSALTALVATASVVMFYVAVKALARTQEKLWLAHSEILNLIATNSYMDAARFLAARNRAQDAARKPPEEVAITITQADRAAS